MGKHDFFVVASYAIVLAFMALIFVLIIVEAKKEQKGVTDDKYDERQKLIQYKAVATGFVVFLVLQWIQAMLCDLNIYKFEAAFRGWAFSGYISLAVVMTCMILKDADMTPAQRRVGPDVLYIAILIAGVAALGITIRNIIVAALTENNFLTIAMGVVLVYIPVIHFAKNVYDKKHSDDDLEEQGARE